MNEESQQQAPSLHHIPLFSAPASPSLEQPRGDATAPPTIFATTPSTSPTGRDEITDSSRPAPRPDATSPTTDPASRRDHTLSVQDAVARFYRAGYPRTPRSVQRYCQREDLDCIEHHTMQNTKIFLIKEASVDRLIEHWRDAATTRSSFADPHIDIGATPATAPPTIFATTPSTSPTGRDEITDSSRPAPRPDATPPTTDPASRRDTTETREAYITLKDEYDRLKKDYENEQLVRKAREMYADQLESERVLMMNQLQERAQTIGEMKQALLHLGAPPDAVRQLMAPADAITHPLKPSDNPAPPSF